MRRKLSKTLEQPVYLWLLGIYPILYLYSENFGLVIEKEVLSCLVWMLIATTVGFLLTNTLLRQAHMTALGLSVCSIAFSLAGHLYSLVFYRAPILIWSLSVVVLTAAIVFGFHRFKRQDLYKQITPVVNVILIALVLSQIVNLASKSTSVSTIAQSLSTTSALNADNLEIPKINDSAEHPDIYYIIPDGYPSDLWLQDSMNYDNARFTEALEDRGFTVVPHAQSNYAATLLSLASVLNMQHYQSNPTPLGDLDYLRLSIADSRVARQLLQLGYSYVQFLSGYLIPSPIADINRDFTRGGAIDIGFGQNDFSVEILNETSEGVRDPNELGHFYKQSFISLYLDTTLLRIVRAQLEELIGEDNSAPLALFARQRFLDTITEMETLVRMPEATFAIIHLMKPHGPLTFNEQGEGVNETWNPSHQEYFAEFQFTNAKFLEMIDTILQGSDHEPIIIFQADHSTLYGLVWTEDWRLIHFDPYFALFLPESYEFSFPKPFTLINTFPIILNEFFGTEIEMQSNLLLELLVGYDAPFEQKDVTEIFAHK